LRFRREKRRVLLLLLLLLEVKRREEKRLETSPPFSLRLSYLKSSPDQHSVLSRTTTPPAYSLTDVHPIFPFLLTGVTGGSCSSPLLLTVTGTPLCRKEETLSPRPSTRLEPRLPHQNPENPECGARTCTGCSMR